MDEQKGEAAEAPDGQLAEEFLEVEMAAGFGRDDRAMIRTLGAMIEGSAKTREATSDRVAFAIDRMLIAACERVARICGADVADASADPRDES